MSRPIEEYALLGDGQTAALLSGDGLIDWLCWPRFDDDACFAALLGTDENGHWSIAPTAPVTQRSRRYQADPQIMDVRANITLAEFDMQAGNRCVFMLSYGAAHEHRLIPIDAEAARPRRDPEALAQLDRPV